MTSKSQHWDLNPGPPAIGDASACRPQANNRNVTSSSADFQPVRDPNRLHETERRRNGAHPPLALSARPAGAPTSYTRAADCRLVMRMGTVGQLPARWLYQWACGHQLHLTGADTSPEFRQLLELLEHEPCPSPAHRPALGLRPVTIVDGAVVDLLEIDA